MKYFNWLLTGTALALCLALSAPCEIQATSSKKETSRVHKSSMAERSAAAKKSSADKVKKSDRNRSDEKAEKTRAAKKSKSAKKSDKLARNGGKEDRDRKLEKNRQKTARLAKKSDRDNEKSPAKKRGSDKSKNADAWFAELDHKTDKSVNSVKSDKLDAAVKTAAKSDKDAKSNTSDKEREIWMERARESEILGKASWYGKDFHNKATASGLDYDMHTFTAAHRTLPMGTVVKVTDQKKGKSVMVCVTDRGPYVRGRIIDLSYAAARKLDLDKRGVCRVKLEVVSDEKGAPLKPNQAYFVRFGAGAHKDKVGPFKGFADAAAMHEALRQAHPDAEVVLDTMR